MKIEDAIIAMEDVFGMKKGYEKNPVAVDRFKEVTEELNKAGIDTLTPENQGKFEEIAGRYIVDRGFKTGTKFGWYNRKPDDSTSSDYKMDIDENGNFIEESKEERYFNGAKTTHIRKNEYNKHGLGMKSEQTTQKYKFGCSNFERKTVVTRNSDLITAKVESTEHSGINACVRNAEKKDNMTCEVELGLPYATGSDISARIDTKSLEVMDTWSLHSHMKEVRDERKSDYSLTAFDGKVVTTDIGRPTLTDYTLPGMKVDQTHKPSFVLTYNKDEAFRETAKDMGLRTDLEKKVKISKIKEIYEKVKYNIKSVTDKFTKRTQTEQNQSRDIM